MLLRALDLAAAGRRVLVLERERILGGAWCSPAMLGFVSVEAGVHLIENRRSVYRRLEDAGIDLSRESAGTMGIWRSIRMPLSLARFVSFSGVLLRAVFERDGSAIGTTFPRALRSLGSLFVAFRYPNGGAGAMVRSLAQRLEEHGIVPILDCRIEEVILSRDAPGGVCRTTSGFVEFDSFCFSSRAHCPIRIGGELLERRVKTRETFSLLVSLKRCHVSDFSYVEILADGWLRRVRDVTEFVIPRPPPSTRILCIQLRESRCDVGASVEEHARRAIGRLGELGLVARSAEVVAFELNRFRYETLSDRDLVALASRHGALDAIKTTDFAEDVARSVEKPTGRRA